MASSEAPGSPMADIGQFPALSPPAGVIPNLIHPYNRGDEFTVAATIIVGLMVLLVTNRQYTKMFIMRKLGWDDRMLEKTNSLGMTRR